MRIWRWLLAALFFATPALSQTADVPLNADGDVDIESVIASFHVGVPIRTSAVPNTEFVGEILEQSFAGTTDGVVGLNSFMLEIDAPSLSEHATYLLAVLLTDTLCLGVDLRPGLVLWQNATNLEQGIWRVSTACEAIDQQSDLNM